MVGLTGEEQFKLRARRALETKNSAFKPRGKANKATFEKMKEEFDTTREHVTIEADRIIEQIKPLVALFSGDSTDPRERIDTRILQNALNVKANKRDRKLIRAQRVCATAKVKQEGCQKRSRNMKVLERLVFVHSWIETYKVEWRK